MQVISNKKPNKKAGTSPLRLSKNKSRSRENPLLDASSAGTREILESDNETFYKNEEPKTSKMNTPTRSKHEVVDLQIKTSEIFEEE